MSDISLTSAMRSNLSNLQSVNDLFNRTSDRLSTGKKVNSASDDAAAFFAAQDHMGHASDLAARKQSMGEAIQTVKAASDGITAITKLIEQAKGLATAARSGTATDRAALATQFGGLMTQIDQLAGDAGYKGTNFLASAGNSLVVEFNESGTSSLTITGADSSSTGLGIAAAANSWVADVDIDAAVADLGTALSTLRTQASTLASNNGVISARQDFVASMINTLTAGADKLTAADQNEEGANMLALQTRQQLGISALSLTSQAQQSILKLF
ncbi:MAG: flagellin [Gemmatimonadota bacterium]